MRLNIMAGKVYNLDNPDETIPREVAADHVRGLLAKEESNWTARQDPAYDPSPFTMGYSMPGRLGYWHETFETIEAVRERITDLKPHSYTVRDRLGGDPYANHSEGSDAHKEYLRLTAAYREMLARYA